MVVVDTDLTMTVVDVHILECRVLDIADLQNAELWQKAGLLGPSSDKQSSMQPDSDRELFADAMNQSNSHLIQ